MHQDRSLWWSRQSDYAPSLPLQGDMSADVCIIGGGIAGLSAAMHLRRADRGVSVVLLEGQEIGAGASGRNAGQMLVQFGSDWAGNLKRYGASNMGAALDYVHEGIGIAERLSQEGLDFDYASVGTIKVGLISDDPAAIDSYRDYLEKAGQGRHLTDLSSLEVQDEIASPYLSKGVFDPRGGTNDPLKLARALKQAAEQAGATVHEYSPVVAILTESSGIRVETGQGSVRCKKLILATNAYTHLLGDSSDAGLDRRQRALMVRAAATRPISQQHWAAAGWRSRCGINIVSDLFFSFAPTTDGRVVSVGGYYIDQPRHGSLEPSADWRLKQDSMTQLGQFFPTLAGVETDQVWGGPISVTRDSIPHVGTARDPRIIYAAGCWGAGVPLSLRHGETLADLALDRRTASTDMWFVQRSKADWPMLVSGPTTTLMMKAMQRKARSIAKSLCPAVHLG